MGATAAAVTAAVLVVTLVLTAAALTVVCAEVFDAVPVVSACVGLTADLVLALDLDEDLAPVPDLADPDAALPLLLSRVSSFGVVDEPLVWAPPLLLTITPEPASALDEVDPDVGYAPDTDDDPATPELPAPSVVPFVPVAPAVPDAPVVFVDPDVGPDVPPVEPEDVDPMGELDDDELDDDRLRYPRRPPRGPSPPR